MTVKEMHIEVSQSTQKIAGNRTRKLQPEELDWLLVKNEQRFIQSRVKRRKNGSGGFQIDQVDTDAIRTLLKYVTVPAQIETDKNLTIYKSLVPGDYSYLFTDSSEVRKLCSGETAEITSETKQVHILPFKLSTKTTDSFYTEVIITVGSITASIQTINTEHFGTYTGVPTKQQWFEIKDVLQWHLSNKGLNVYWQNYEGAYYPHSFIIESSSPTASILIDGETTQSTVKTFNFKRYTQEGIWKQNRLIQSDTVSLVIDTPFLKSSALSPVSELVDKAVMVYGDESFIISSMQLGYVKKPRRISLILGQDSELPEDFHPNICDLTTEYFKAMIADPNWEVKLKDNMLRTNV
jgi:hypothetical protein